MLTKDERILLNNVIESLNGLYDGVSTASDVHALLTAIAMTLQESELAGAFEKPLWRLTQIVHSTASPDKKRELGLIATDGMRAFVAEQLMRDQKQNPKQRRAL